MTRTTTILKRNNRPYALERARIRLSHPDAGQRDFAGERISIGSSPHNDFAIDRPSVSRHHARIETRGNALLLRDLGSTNGTLIDRTRILLAQVPDRATLRLGDERIELQVTDEMARFELSEHDGCGKLVGHSVAMRRLFSEMEKAARSSTTVLLNGESGVGKELVARAIHDLSPRRDQPFEVIDCGALAPGIVDDELFGHEKGAFTGADAARPGPFEIADGGTVFLDEIGELDLSLQPRLLRVLETGVIRRLGSNQERSVDVRVVAATNRDLPAMITSGEFRSDLYYRLAVIRLEIPALRERLEDLEILCRALLQDIYARHGSAAPLQIDETVLKTLRSRRWAGNVRELRNFLERAVLLDGGGALPSSSDRAELNYARERDRAMDAFEAEFLARALERYGDNLSKISRQCDMHRGNLLRLLRKHGLR